MINDTETWTGCGDGWIRGTYCVLVDGARSPSNAVMTNGLLVNRILKITPWAGGKP